MEKGTRVLDSTTGDVIATRDAQELDELGSNRTIQIVDFASRKIDFQQMRGIADYVTVDDGDDLTSLDSEIENNVLTVGDKSTLVAHVNHSLITGSVNLTPLIVNKMPSVTSFEPESGANDGYAELPSSFWDNTATISVHGNPTYEDRLFVRFLFNIPAGTQILSATLNMYSVSRYATTVDVVMLHANSSALTMSNSSLFNDSNWEGQSAAHTILSNAASNYWATIDVTSTVQNLLDAAYYTPAYWAFMMKSLNEVMGSMVGFSSFEGGNLPRLDVVVSEDAYSILETKTTEIGTIQFNEGGAPYKSPIVAWDLYGAEKVAMHVSSLSSGNGVKVFGSLI